MRFLVISDSHRNTNIIIKVLEKSLNKIDAIIHLGDMVRDIDYISSLYPNIPIYKVKGNNDFSSNVEPKLLIEACGKKILLTHGHTYDVYYGYDTIALIAENLNVDVCLFGHTHTPLIAHHKNCLIMNPGSISQPRNFPIPTYGILKIEQRRIIPSIVGVFGDLFKPIDINSM